MMLLLVLGATTVASMAQGIMPSDQAEIRQAIRADINYRDGRMVTSALASSFRSPAFPRQVTIAEGARLKRAPSAGSVPDTLVGFTTSIDTTTMSRKGDDVVVDFTETTMMPRPHPLPEYGYATPQIATLIQKDGIWLVDSIAFAPGSGMDGATCQPGRWAGDC
ncbi:hypothetical protein ACFQ9V_09530 [Leifsonia sp. NPDC056665]|uniref:hypothetical protein n=1 Tax=Leifsonia sp. NPDC056665 TaxID=3345901 RepID=UPI003690A65A